MREYDYIPEELTSPTLDVPEELHSGEDEFAYKNQYRINWDSI